MNKLLSLNPVKRASDVQSLRRLYDTCETQIRGLEALGVASDSYGNLLCPVLMKIIPEEITLEFSRRKDTKEDWKVRDLISFLQKEIESRERAAILTQQTTGSRGETRCRTPDKQQKEYKTGNKGTPSAAALNTLAQGQCIFCSKEGHVSEKCSNTTVNERKTLLQEQRRCFKCLKNGHIAKFCKRKLTPCRLCRGRHNSALCEGGDNGSENTATGAKDTVISAVTPSSQNKGNKTVLLQTAVAVMRNQNGDACHVRCLIDGGSQRTFIRKGITHSFSLPTVGEEILKIHTFGCNIPRTSKSKRVQLTLESTHTPGHTIQLEALESPRISGALISMPSNDIRNILETKGLELADIADNDHAFDSTLEIDVLIGSDYYWEVITGRVERLTPSLVAMETIFGWTVQGPSYSSSLVHSEESTFIYHTITECEDIISNQLRTFWEVETLGVNDLETMSTRDEKAIRHFEESVTYKDGRYEVRLPWKSGEFELPRNYDLAKKRLLSLGNRFRKDISLFNTYNEIINEQVQNGVVEPVSNHTKPDKNIVHYLPHHPVVKTDRQTTKLRIVYDASAHEENKPSLNDCLYTGPNLNPNLLDVLLKFRMNKIAFSVDITKAFLQIGLAESDRDAVRFLWFRDPPFEVENPSLQELRFKRVVFGVAASPFLLAATIRHHLKSYIETHPTTCSLVNECLYMDDLLSGGDTLEDTANICKDVKNIFDDAGMQLQKWRTNSPDLQAVLEKEEFKSIGTSQDDTQNIVGNMKILGLTWISEPDEFRYEVEPLLEVARNSDCSKRGILKVSARLFDPIGFISPYSLRAKCIFQELWRKGLNWDERLPDDILAEWEKWLAELHHLQVLRQPRCCFSSDRSPEETIQIHAFSDASEYAYGAVVYIRHSTGAQINTNFLLSKTRVAPIRRLTLPRLELMGALIAARLVAYVKKSVISHPARTYLWTDSTITLHWIKGDASRWKPFVANRVTEIQVLTNPSEWSHCEGRHNPADILSRGAGLMSLCTSELWWHGPYWLQLKEEEWPKLNSKLDQREANVELCNVTENITLNTSTEESKITLFDLAKFSSLNRVLRITAWIMRYVQNCKTPDGKVSGPLTDTEIRNATVYWVKTAQEDEFTTELKVIATGEDLKANSKLKDLSVSIDEDGLLYLKTRLEEAALSLSERHPWILPTNHRLTELLIQACHKRLLHSGVGATLACLRERYWILKARKRIKGVISRCFVCRKSTARAGDQETAILPRDRVTQTPTFETSGMDFCGPVYIKGGTSTEKAYILLITCAVTRAIHLELVENLTTFQFLMAFRRFVSRRGLPKIIYSDNATTFKSADKALCETWRKIKGKEVREYFGNNNIRWISIVPLSAWWGGFWERLVRSVKTPLRKILGRACLSYTEMETTLYEIEAVLNSRPLTYSYTDPEELSPLTPAHFLIGERIATLPNHTAVKETNITSLTKRELIKRQMYREKLLQNFWIRWRKEYLLELRTAHFRKRPKVTSELKINDLVLLHDERLPRHLWKMGRVEELYVGRDKKIRCGLIRVPGGKTVKRSVQHLYPLEVEQ